ncbi:ATP-binding domain-containing protein [Agrococcus sp. KRD186]|uniref:ATP-binding domain-containing protein n=1 Tax=Agrococcus sp. KRD186 TaxID=2729730 RepID=UPI0019CFA8CD
MHNRPRAQLITGVEYADFYRDDEDEELAGAIRRYRDADEQDALLLQALETLWADGWDPHEILVLSPRRRSAAHRAFGETTDASPQSGATHGIRWGTVHRYKGLESPVVIVTDVDGRSPGWEDLLYVGMTRATERLIVLTSLEELHERM